MSRCPRSITGSATREWWKMRRLPAQWRAHATSNLWANELANRISVRSRGSS